MAISSYFPPSANSKRLRTAIASMQLSGSGRLGMQPSISSPLHLPGTLSKDDGQTPLKTMCQHLAWCEWCTRTLYGLLACSLLTRDPSCLISDPFSCRRHTHCALYLHRFRGYPTDTMHMRRRDWPSILQVTAWSVGVRN